MQSIGVVTLYRDHSLEMIPHHESQQMRILPDEFYFFR